MLDPELSQKACLGRIYAVGAPFRPLVALSARQFSHLRSTPRRRIFRALDPAQAAGFRCL